MVNKNKNPETQNIVEFSFKKKRGEPKIEDNQEKIFIPVGTPITIVAAVK